MDADILRLCAGVIGFDQRSNSNAADGRYSRRPAVIVALSHENGACRVYWLRSPLRCPRSLLLERQR